MRTRLPTILLALALFVPMLVGLVVALYIVFSMVYIAEEVVFGLGLEYRRYPFGLILAIILVALAAFLAAPLAWFLAWSLAQALRPRPQ